MESLFTAYMLVDEENGNILSVLCEPVKCLLDGRCLGLGIDHKEIPLRIRRLCDMLCVGNHKNRI